ncbi:hypothetical protein KY362_00075 [Candidatus Woesearchaeota archaeon]|nr:hypothetical protein [Candidatus Woesearchaeota archaeon]
MHYYRKAMSPLIAAVLLMVVVVGIGAVVTGIVRNQVTSDKQVIERTTTDIDCSTQVEIVVPTVNDDFLICVGSDYVNFTVENSGSIQVDDLQVKIFGADGFTSNDSVMANGLEVGQVYINDSIGFASAETGAIEEVHLIPRKKVTGESNKIFCSEAMLRFADVSTC